MLLRNLQSLLPAGSMRRALASSLFWSAGGAVISRGCVMLSAIAMARLLGADGYGKWGLIDSTITTFAQYGAMGLTKTTTKHVAELKKRDPRRGGDVLSFIGVVLFIGLFAIALLLALLSSHIAEHIFRAPSLAWPLLLGSAYLFLMPAGTVMQAALAGFGDYRGIAVNNAWQGLSVLAVAPVLILWLGLPGAVLGMSVSYAVALGLALERVKRLAALHGMPFSLAGAWRERGIFCHYCVPLSLAGGIAVPATWIANTFTARVVGFAGLGGYMAADRFRGLLLFVPGTMKQVTLPMLSETRAARDLRRFRRVLVANLGVNVGVAALGAIPVIIMSKWLMSWFGPEFRGDSSILVILSISAILQAGANVFALVTASAGRTWLNFWSSTSYAILLVLGVWWLVPPMGATGLAYSMALAQLALLLAHAGVTIWLMRSGRLFEAQNADDLSDT